MPGSTPTSGIASFSRTSAIDCAVAVLQATTSAFAPCADEPFADRERAVGDEVVVAFAVGGVERVGDIDERFVGQLRPDRPQHRQTAQTRVEYADRRARTAT